MSSPAPSPAATWWICLRFGEYTGRTGCAHPCWSSCKWRWSPSSRTSPAKRWTCAAGRVPNDRMCFTWNVGIESAQCFTWNIPSGWFSSTMSPPSGNEFGRAGVSPVVKKVKGYREKVKAEWRPMAAFGASRLGGTMCPSDVPRLSCSSQAVGRVASLPLLRSQAGMPAPLA